jgi:hypothetical protein
VSGSGNTSALDIHVWCAKGAPAGSIALSWVNLGGDATVLSLGAALDGQVRTLVAVWVSSVGLGVGVGVSMPVASSRPVQHCNA